MFRLVLRHCAVIATAGVALACASSGASGAGGAGSGAASASVSQVRRDRATISGPELRDLQASNLFEVVQRLHPEWLSGHNAAAIGGKTTNLANEVQVYIDTQRTGTTDILKQLAPNVAGSLRYYSASEAQARFGNGNLNGVIQIVTATKP
ncbi:MAG: hypothetical protein JWM41_1904 [Gemmatimonadetes bacterium]|nr:hypothetical protein [Gemmatimonadota bacterium]